MSCEFISFGAVAML